jgi:hypothetical protein
MTTTQGISCGMPLSEPGDCAMGDPTKDYFLHCVRPAVEELMAKLPAWKED